MVLKKVVGKLPSGTAYIDRNNSYKSVGSIPIISR